MTTARRGEDEPAPEYAFPRETPADPPGQLVNTPYGPVHVVIDGPRDAPSALAFVPGIPGNTRDARYLGPALARRGLTCVRFDMPGFGNTARDVMPGVSALERAAFVRAVMRTLGHETFAIAGHSIGGATALACAARFPDDITALVLVNSVGVRRHRGLVMPTTLHRTLAAFAHNVPSALASPLASMLKRYYEGRGTRSDTPVDVATVAHHLGIVGALDFVEQRAHVRMVRAPTLVVSADDDPFVGPLVATSLVRALAPHAPVVTHLRAPTGGHHGQKFAAWPVADWLQSTLRAR